MAEIKPVLIPRERLEEEISRLRQERVDFNRIFAAMIRSQGGKISISKGCLEMDINGEVVREDNLANYSIDFILKENE